MCLAQGNNTVSPVGLEPATFLYRVKQSTAEPLRSPKHYFLHVIKFYNLVYLVYSLLTKIAYLNEELKDERDISLIKILSFPVAMLFC